MKNTLLKVMGIVMTLAILAGLLMASVPVSAAAMAWSANAVPSTTAPNILTTSTTANRVLAVAPNGTTVLVSDNGTLLKSTDAGVTFTPTAVAPPAVFTMIKFASDSTSVVATEGTTVYYSADGGSTWGNTFAPAGPVYSLDVQPGPNIVVGSNGFFSLYKAAGLFASPWTQ